MDAGLLSLNSRGMPKPISVLEHCEDMFAAVGVLFHLSRRWMTCFGLQLATSSGPTPPRSWQVALVDLLGLLGEMRELVRNLVGSDQVIEGVGDRDVAAQALWYAAQNSEVQGSSGRRTRGLGEPLPRPR